MTHTITNWQQIFRGNFRSVEALADFLQLNTEQRLQIRISPSFPLSVPRRLAEKMQKGTLDCPIVRQFLPLNEETISGPTDRFDPVCDSHFVIENKLLQKYAGRALLICSGTCAMHCRYCFRQHFPYPTDPSFDAALQRIALDSSLHEVILSGGDPLSLPNQRLAPLLERLNSISHLKRIRFHTRFPIGIPERIDAPFLELLSGTQKQIFLVIHCNHASELDHEVLSALTRVRRTGAVVLNQAVLLRGVNDDATTLTALSEHLIDHGILPYYLHQLDPVVGASHFEVASDAGLSLIAEMQAGLPGYGVPKYVQEIPGKPSKLPVV